MELQTKVIVFLQTSPNEVARNLVKELVSELAKQENELNELTAKLRLAEQSETHLKIAEKVLIEKDDKISVLKRALDKRDLTIKQQLTQIKSLEDTICNNIQKLSEAEIKIALARKQRDDYAEKLQDTVAPETAAFLDCEMRKYRGAIKDLVGTFNARADHDREIAEKLKAVLGGNA